MKTIEFKGEIYPAFQAEGFAAKFAFPFAYEICNGVGYDIGCNRVAWSFPNSIPWDIAIDSGQDALALPNVQVDYIFSSHCLEHLPNWVEALDHWISRLRTGGTLFLYLPHSDQLYWRPYHNRKHIHSFDESVIEGYFKNNWQLKNTFVSKRDLNHSFIAIAEKI